MHSRWTSVSEPRQSVTCWRSSRRMTESATWSAGQIDVGCPVPRLALTGRLLGAHPVHRAPVRHREQPRKGRARRRVVVRRGSPYLQVDVLRGLLAVPAVAQHTAHQAEHPGTGEVVEGGERVDIPLGHLVKQRGKIGGHER